MDLLILWSLSFTGDLLPMFSRLAGAEAGAVCLLTTTTGSLVSWMAAIVLWGQLGGREGVRERDSVTPGDGLRVMELLRPAESLRLSSGVRGGRRRRRLGRGPCG